MSKSGPKRTNFQIERDRREIADLYLQGWIQADIAAHLNEDEETRGYTLTQQMISYDLARLQEQWRESALIDIDEAKARELAKIDRLEREYWRAWVRSCEDTETVKQRGKPGDMPGRVDTENVERTVKGQIGDPRFLQGVQWCVERRCKILGIDAASHIELGGAGGGAIPVQIIGIDPDAD